MNLLQRACARCLPYRCYDHLLDVLADRSLSVNVIHQSRSALL